MPDSEPTVETLLSVLDHAVDAGWADQLVRALEQIAQGRKHPQDIAIRALQHAGLWPLRQMQWWDTAPTISQESPQIPGLTRSVC